LQRIFPALNSDMDIRIENLVKRFGHQRAVDNISFEVKTGEIVGFLGPNGAGKSTTMKIITGYLGMSEGDVYIGEKSIREHGDELKKHIGYLPENNPLYTDMPVIDYLFFCAALQGIEKERIPVRVREMIQITGLVPEKHKKIGELSKGYRQRVGLAQAMIHDPEILILDEPTTGLDPNQIVEIRSLIREMGKHKTVILSTHILPEVEATCDRILIINKGKIVANGTAESLRNQSSGNVMMRVVIEGTSAREAEEMMLQLPRIKHVSVMDNDAVRLEVTAEPGTNLGRDIFQLCVQKGWVLTEAVPVETRLEDIFRNLTIN
jgi:ABC-2 type transport system ATP-binding protein